jgi:hypothetical protein
VNFYHSFTQIGRMDRQELRLVFERGDVRLDEWVPVQATIHAVIDDASLETLKELFPDAEVDVTASYASDARACQGRHKSLRVDKMVELQYGRKELKMQRYGELVRALFVDQLAWVADRRHCRRLTEQNVRDSLALAAEADELARRHVS